MRIERVFALMFLLWASVGFAQPAHWNAGPGDELDASLVTIGPGDIYWTRFGHNAIVITDRRSGEARFYNYGIFDFAQKDFFLNFIRGRMQYLAVAEPFDRALVQYRHEGREITQQHLNLSPAQRVQLKQFLDWNVAPENSAYFYDYYVNNCSTKVRDAIDRVLGGAIKRNLGGRSRGYTWRMHTQRLTAPELWLYLGTHLGLSGYVDRPVSYWEESFLPVELSRRIVDVRVTDDAGQSVPLIADTVELAQARIAQPSDEPPRWRVWFVLIGLALGAAVFLLSRSSSGASRFASAVLLGLVWFVCAFAGTGLLTLWFGTAHEAAHANENLFVFSPLAWLLLPAVVSLARGRPTSRFMSGIAWAIVAISLLGVAVKILPAFNQDNLDWLLLLIPFHLAAAYALRHRALA